MFEASGAPDVVSMTLPRLYNTEVATHNQTVENWLTHIFVGFYRAPSSKSCQRRWTGLEAHGRWLFLQKNMLVASRFFSLLCSLAERWSRASSCSKRLGTFGVSLIPATVRFGNLALPGTMRLHSAKVERISASLTELHEKAGLPATPEQS